MGKPQLQQASLLTFCAPPPPPRLTEAAPKRLAVARAEGERERSWTERLVDTPSIRDINAGNAGSSLLCLVREDGLLDQVLFLQRLGADSRFIEAPALGLAQGRTASAGEVDVCAFMARMRAAMSQPTGRRYVDSFMTQGPYGRAEPVPGVEIGVEDWRVQG